MNDTANNGGTYKSTTPLEARLGKDGFYHVTGRRIETPNCIPDPGQN